MCCARPITNSLTSSRVILGRATAAHGRACPRSSSSSLQETRRRRQIHAFRGTNGDSSKLTSAFLSQVGWNETRSPWESLEDGTSVNAGRAIRGATTPILEFLTSETAPTRIDLAKPPHCHRADPVGRVPWRGRIGSLDETVSTSRSVLQNPLIPSLALDTLPTPNWRERG